MKIADAPTAVIYSFGLVNLSLCAPADWTRKQVEEFANAEQPTGISSQWEASEKSFATGEESGGFCKETRGNEVVTNEARRHWLLVC